MIELTPSQRREFNRIAAQAARRGTFTSRTRAFVDKGTHNVLVVAVTPLAFIANLPRVLDSRKVIRKAIHRGVELGSKPYATREERIEIETTELEEWLVQVRDGKFTNFEYKDKEGRPSEDVLRAALIKLGVKDAEIARIFSTSDEQLDAEATVLETKALETAEPPTPVFAAQTAKAATATPPRTVVATAS